MNLYLVRYAGLWLGGKALVFAKSKKSALRKVKEHCETVNFETPTQKPTVELLEPTDIVYNDNGDY